MLKWVVVILQKYFNLQNNYAGFKCCSSSFGQWTRKVSGWWGNSRSWNAIIWHGCEDSWFLDRHLQSKWNIFIHLLLQLVIVLPALTKYTANITEGQRRSFRVLHLGLNITCRTSRSRRKYWRMAALQIKTSNQSVCQVEVRFHVRLY